MLSLLLSVTRPSVLAVERAGSGAENSGRLLVIDGRTAEARAIGKRTLQLPANPIRQRPLVLLRTLFELTLESGAYRNANLRSFALAVLPSHAPIIAAKRCLSRTIFVE